MDIDSVCALVRQRENDFKNDETTISKYVTFSLHETVERITAYINSVHISGSVDSLDREKPFFNIVTAARNIWYRATDIDRKNIRIKATKATDVLGAFLASVHLQEWMRRSNFGVFLNEWGRVLATYGSAVVKFVETGGQLYASVVSWDRLIIDSVSFDADVKIEKLYYTPAQLLRNKAYNKDQVKELIQKHQEQSRKNLDGEQMDNKNNYIEVYEVHGELSLAVLKEAKGIEPAEGDEDIYVQQMHAVSYVEIDSDSDEKEYEDFTLACGREKDPYMITHLIEEDGRVIGIGAVEHLFEAQWMTNHSMKQIKDQLDLASKLIFQTADGNYVGQNALDSIETGDILVYESGKPLTQLANNSHDITSLQNFAQQWKMLAQDITSTPDAIRGNNLPSGTAYRLGALMQEESHSLFEMMTENKGLAVEAMMRRFVIPYIKKQMDTTEEIAATLDEHGISKVDMLYINAEVIRRNNKHMADQMFAGKIAQPLDMVAEAQNIKRDLQTQGNQRFFAPSEIDDVTWKELFKDLEWDVEVEVTGESSDKNAVMTTLTTVLQTIAGNPTILTNPTFKMLFNKILTATGEVSMIELDQDSRVDTPQPELPAPDASKGTPSPVQVAPNAQGNLAPVQPTT